MNRENIIRMARGQGLPETETEGVFIVNTDDLGRMLAAERERICKAIKEEDDYCVTEGDYMLDSNDCIAVAKSEWVRPDYSAGAIRARGKV